MKQIQNMNNICKNWFFGLKNTLAAAFILSVYTRVVHGGHHQHHHQGCGQDELVRCARPLQVITDSTEFAFVATKKELDELCPDLQKGLLCIHSYTRRCMTLTQRNHFHKLYKGTSNVIKELCTAGSYQEEFLQHAPCMREVVKEYEICTMRYQAAMETLSNPILKNNTSQEDQEHDTIKSVCCSFQEYMDCATHTMRRSCGEETAQFTKSFLDRMSSSLIKIHCSEYAGNTSKCRVYSAAPPLLSSVFTVFWTAVLTMLAVTTQGVLFR